jgi:hypothetical protein
MKYFWMELSVLPRRDSQQSAKTLFLMFFAESRKLIARVHKCQFMDEHQLTVLTHHSCSIRAEH